MSARAAPRGAAAATQVGVSGTPSASHRGRGNAGGICQVFVSLWLRYEYAVKGEEPGERRSRALRHTNKRARRARKIRALGAHTDERWVCHALVYVAAGPLIGMPPNKGVVRKEDAHEQLLKGGCKRSALRASEDVTRRLGKTAHVSGDLPPLHRTHRTGCCARAPQRLICPSDIFHKKDALKGAERRHFRAQLRRWRRGCLRGFLGFSWSLGRHEGQGGGATRD